MRDITLQAEVRTQVGKGSRAIRREGKVPGIYYIHGEENIAITVEEKSLKPLIFTSEAHIVNLKLNTGTDKSCILRSIQFDPVSERAIHFDLQGLRENEEITIEVPIVITGGTPLGVRDGGVLQQIIHSIKIYCLPKYIPEHIEVNVAELKINHFIHVRDLKVENVTILEDEEGTIVGVVPPTIEKEPEVATPAAEAAVEPEVIGKGKKLEEGAEGEAGTEKKAEAAPAPAAKPAAKEEKKK
jgi:large subunit ribosomal protein L25